MISTRMLCATSVVDRGAIGLALALTAETSLAQSTPPTRLDQGDKGTEAARGDCDSRDLGWRLLPLAQIEALKQQNGQLFFAHDLQQYGYLRDDEMRAYS